MTLITVVGTKPVPVAVTTSEDDPTSPVEGETEEMTGAGLSTSKLPGVLLTVPLTTTTERLPPLVNWLAGTAAVSEEALTYVVASAMPPTLTTLLLMNPEPETVSVIAAEPAGTVAGLTELTTGVALVLPPPPPDPLPDPLPEEDPPPPPQPTRS